MKRSELLLAASKLASNGLSAGARMVVPSLDYLNKMRAELGHEPITRECVPENIMFADEMPECEG